MPSGLEERSKYVVTVGSAGLDESLVKRLADASPAVLVHVALPGQPGSVASAIIETAGAPPPDLAAWAACLDVSEKALACYRVSEELRWTRPGASLPAGGGVSFIALVERAPGMDPAQFEEHWAKVHRPLAIEHHKGMLGYVQNVVREEMTPTAGPPVDGIAELVFATGDHVDRDLFPTEESRRIITEDVARFVGKTRAGLYRRFP